MKKMTALLLAVLMLLALPVTAMAAEVQAMVDTLPSVEEFKAMDSQQQLEAYDRTQSAYDAYQALTEEEKAQVENAEAVFEALFSHFNTLIAPADAVASVGAMVDALPTVEEFKAMDKEAQVDAYNRTQEAYNAYMELNAEEKEQLPGAEAHFDALFSHYNTLIAPADSGKVGSNTLVWVVIALLAAMLLVPVLRKKKAAKA